ncbi:enoyl-CoA hydratase/isomerase family protein [Austwickia chelonae]|uniref:enoyl-CoA hydratase/isomerase family protein n=1 Tax=Austwickia chelonae TaxID=100225 RepID=UPI000E232740|nr:enoyl-CoA hydratase/isomerase family protein [Austwickia chelonae]
MRHVAGPRGDLNALAGDDDGIRVCRDGAVGVIALHRGGQHNALTAAMGRRLLDAVVRAAADPSVRCLLLVGEDGSFCAGDDLHGVQAWNGGKPGEAPFDPLTHDAYYLRICESLIQAPKPVVAGLTGVTAGAGLDIACAADYRVAGEQARFASRLINVGHVGHAVLLPRIIGVGRATNWYLTGRLVGAREAFSAGFLDEVVPDDEVHTRATRLARELACAPTASIGLFKDLRERAWGQPVQAGLRLQDACHLVTHDQVRDASRGIEAAADGHRADFQGD